MHVCQCLVDLSVRIESTKFLDREVATFLHVDHLRYELEQIPISQKAAIDRLRRKLVT